jgi:hypothetical protein
VGNTRAWSLKPVSTPHFVTPAWHGLFWLMKGSVFFPCWSLRRGGFQRAFDACCGLCIMALYFLYLGVVKSSLSVFDCSRNEDGVYILDADPSIVCHQVPCGVHVQDHVPACKCCRSEKCKGGRPHHGWP